MIRRGNVKNSDQVKIAFVLPDDHPLVKASVVGTFNDWDASANPLKKRRNGTYSAVVTLDKGKQYVYRYISAAGEWFNADDADKYVPNDMGTEDGVLLT